MNEETQIEGQSTDTQTGDTEVTAVPGDLKLLTFEAAAIKNEIDEMDMSMKAKSKRLQELKATIQHTLDLMEIDKVIGHGFTFYKKSRSSVQTPKTPEEKEALFQFLRDKGIFTEMVSINSQTLNKLYNDLESEAISKGNFAFKLPGIEAPKVSTTLEMKRGK